MEEKELYLGPINKAVKVQVYRKNIKNVHHLHLWCISEHNVAIECHIESDNNDIIVEATQLLKDKFGITHCNFQVENKSCGECCDL